MTCSERSRGEHGWRRAEFLQGPRRKQPGLTLWSMGVWAAAQGADPNPYPLFTLCPPSCPAPQQDETRNSGAGTVPDLLPPLTPALPTAEGGDSPSSEGTVP